MHPISQTDPACIFPSIEYKQVLTEDFTHASMCPSTSDQAVLTPSILLPAHHYYAWTRAQLQGSIQDLLHSLDAGNGMNDRMLRHVGRSAMMIAKLTWDATAR